MGLQVRIKELLQLHSPAYVILEPVRNQSRGPWPVTGGLCQQKSRDIDEFQLGVGKTPLRY